MATRNLPTPPPEGPTETPTETDRTTPPTDTEEAPASTDSAQQQPAQIHTIYREIFPIIANKVIDKDWPSVTELGEMHDLRVCLRYYAFNSKSLNLTPRRSQTEHDTDVSRLLLTTPLVLSYLILDDMYGFTTMSPGYPLNLQHQTSSSVRVDPPSSANPATPPNEGTL